MATLRLITDAAVERDCGDLLPQLEQLKSAQYSILPRLKAVDGMSPADIRARQLTDRPGYTILIGDSVPRVYLRCSPDGHDDRNMWADKLLVTGGPLTIGTDGVAQNVPWEAPWGAISRVWYGAQPGAGVSSSALYRRWMQEVIQAPSRGLCYRTVASVDDHFDYVTDQGADYSRIGKAARAAIPPHLLEDLRMLPIGADNTDGVWSQWADRPVMVGYSLSGGYQFAELVGLYYIGRTEELRRIRPGIGLHVIWGSYQMDYGWSNALAVASTTIDGCVSAVLNQYGNMPMASYYAGRPIGDCSRAFSAQRVANPIAYLLDIIGDCTQTMGTDQIALSDALSRLASAPSRKEFDALAGQVTQLTTMVTALPAGTAVPVAALPAAASASFVRADVTTQGNWQGLYGKAGCAIAGDRTVMPPGVAIQFSGQAFYTWASATGDVRAPERVELPDRVAACWYAVGEMALDLDLGTGPARQVALYCVDWDTQGRSQTVEVRDAGSGAVLDSRSVVGFGGGKYMIWNLTGHVRIRVANGGPFNAVVSGVFID